MTNKPILDDIIIEGLKNPTMDREEFHKIKNSIYKKYGISKPIPNIEILARYNEKIISRELEENYEFTKLLRKRGVRSLSGVTVVSLLTKPFACPGKCIYCPTYPDLPKSYVSGEPAVARAELNKFDPILQIHNRLRSLEVTGHNIEKNDIRIIGGSWSFYPEDYKEEFIKGIYDAFNSYDETKKYIEETDLSREKFASFKLKEGYKITLSKNLQEAKKINETARCRVIGIAIETRPDMVDEDEVKQFRKHGITRVEIGYQTTIDEINAKNLRGHGNKESINATRLLKDAGFKVVAHMMPNLLGSNPELDRESFEEIFKNPDYRPDEIKIYPMVATPNSELENVYRQGGFEPYDDDTLIDLITDLEAIVPEYVRINRTYRDIPATEIIAGSKLSNLRQIVEEKLQEKGVKIVDIRSREIKDKSNDPKNAILKTYEYEASGGREYFLTYECPDDRSIFSLLRLRIPSEYFEKKSHYIPELNSCALIREIHTFGEQLRVGESGSKFGQHIGFGKRLIEEAERIAREEYSIKKIAVISGVGVRGYYEKRGYNLEGEYMVKEI